MLIVVSTLALLSALPQAGTASRTTSAPLPVQFVLQTSALKKHASVVNNELTITGGARQSYLSSMKVGDFEASGEIAVSGETAATVLVGASVDDDWRPHRRLQLPLPATLGDGWMPMTITSRSGHVTVAVNGAAIAAQDFTDDPYGRFGFEVSRGKLSLRRWHVTREDAYLDPRPLTASNPDLVELGKLPADVAQPRLIHEVHVRYAEDAARHGVEGTVEVEGVVERDGSVSAVRVSQSVDDDLDRAMVQAVRQWRFTPLVLRGEPVRWHLVVTVPFAVHPR